MTNTDTDEAAVEAAAEKFLSAEKAKRVAAATAAHDAALQRLANAQANHAEASSAVAVNDWDGNRKWLLAALEELEVSRAVASHHESALAQAKGRWPEGHRQAALEHARAKLDWDALKSKEMDVRQKVTDAARLLIAAERELYEIGSEQNFTSFSIKTAKETMGLRSYEHDAYVRETRLVIADSLLTACRAEGFSPFTWRDNTPTLVLAPITMPIPGAQAVLEDAESFRKRSADIQREMGRTKRARLQPTGEDA